MSNLTLWKDQGYESSMFLFIVKFDKRCWYHEAWTASMHCVKVVHVTLTITVFNRSNLLIIDDKHFYYISAIWHVNKASSFAKLASIGYSEQSN